MWPEGLTDEEDRAWMLARLAQAKAWQANATPAQLAAIARFKEKQNSTRIGPVTGPGSRPWMGLQGRRSLPCLRTLDTPLGLPYSHMQAQDDIGTVLRLFQKSTCRAVLRCSATGVRLEAFLETWWPGTAVPTYRLSDSHRAIYTVV